MAYSVARAFRVACFFLLNPIAGLLMSSADGRQTFPELPAETCQLQWLAMGNAEHAIFVPAFSGISDTFEKYKVDNTEPMTVNDSYYYICKSVCAVIARPAVDFYLFSP